MSCMHTHNTAFVEKQKKLAPKTQNAHYDYDDDSEYDNNIIARKGEGVTMRVAVF